MASATQPVLAAPNANPKHASYGLASITMAAMPNYAHLDADLRAACLKWNSDLTMANGRYPALSNPPPFLKLMTDGFDTYEEAKEELDRFTKAAGYITVKNDSKSTYARLECARGPQRRHSVAKGEKAKTATTIKKGCLWVALISKTKDSQGKWVCKVKEGCFHDHHGPEEVPEGQRGGQRLTPEMVRKIESMMEQDPFTKPRHLQAMIVKEYPGFMLGKNTIKNWLQAYRKSAAEATEEPNPDESMPEELVMAEFGMN